MRFLVLIFMIFTCVQIHAREWVNLRSFGEPMPSTMYLFSSPNCSHCRTFHKTIFPELIKKYVDTKKAQLVIVDTPTDDASFRAVMLLRCLPEEKASKLLAWLFENQSKWVGNRDPDYTFKQYTQVLGMTQAEFKSCVEDKSLRDAIGQQRDNLSALFGVRSWPTVVLRQNNLLSIFKGTDKRKILTGIDQEIKKFQEIQKSQLANKK